MVETFYLLYDKKRIRLEDVLLRMSHDLFFLDQNYIYKRIFYISENLSYYEQLKEGKKPDSKKNDTNQLSLGFNRCIIDDTAVLRLPFSPVSPHC